MRHTLLVVDDGPAFVATSADLIAAAAAEAVRARGTFRIAVSGGHTPWPVFEALASEPDFPWSQTVVYQVDERVAPRNDPARNLGHLESLIPSSAQGIVAMPVDEPDLDGACDHYAACLPDAFDVVHLGLGADGHTASLVPGDPVLDVTDRLVALTAEPYQGHRRMTLTYPGLSRARSLLWLVTGSGKQDALDRLLRGDTTIPAGRVEAPESTVIASRSAS